MLAGIFFFIFFLEIAIREKTTVFFDEMKTKSPNRSIKDFFKEEYQNLMNFVRGRLDESYYRVSAEDIIQDVALNIFNKIDFDAYVENVAGYVYRAIRNKIIDHQRKRDSVYKTLDETTELTDVAESFYADNENRSVDPYKFHAVLMEVIEKLKPEQQAVIMETEFEGSTYEELSEKWNIPIGTLLARKSRAVKKLKDWINPEDLFGE